MRLYLLRHSVRESPDDFEDAEEGDPEAELTDEGREIAESVGKWMADNDEIPTMLYVSPTVRAQQTAEIIVDQIKSAGLSPPETKTDVGLGPFMSVRGCIMEALADEASERVGIISHRSAIRNGMEQLGKGEKPTPMAMGELRVLKVKRKSGNWEEKQRILPSDLGHPDTY